MEDSDELLRTDLWILHWPFVQKISHTQRGEREREEGREGEREGGREGGREKDQSPMRMPNSSACMAKLPKGSFGGPQFSNHDPHDKSKSRPKFMSESTGAHHPKQ